MEERGEILSTVNAIEILNPYGAMDKVLLLNMSSLSEAYVLRNVVNLIGTYTFSIWYRAESVSQITFNVLGEAETIDSSTEWKKYVKTVKMNNLEDTDIIIIPDANVSSYFYEGCLVDGNKGGPWTPAPEDVFSEIERQGIGNWCYNNDLTYINGGKIYTGSITAKQIAAEAIISDKIAANAITTDKILAGAVSADKLDVNAVTAEKIVAGAVTAAAIAANAITADKIAANAVSAEKIASNAITSDKIVAKAITTEHIAAGAVTANEILAGAVTADKLDVRDLCSMEATIAGFEIGERLEFLYEVSGSATIKNGEITISGRAKSNAFMVKSDIQTELAYQFVLHKCTPDMLYPMEIISIGVVVYSCSDENGSDETIIKKYSFLKEAYETDETISESVDVITNVVKKINILKGSGESSNGEFGNVSESINIYIGDSEYIRIGFFASNGSATFKSPIISGGKANSISYGKTSLYDTVNDGIYIGTNGINTSGDIMVRGVSLYALSNNLFLNTHPVGSIYMSVDSTNPGELYGGEWVAWGSGKVPVGVNASEAEFNTVEKSGGEKTHTLTVNEMPSHTHMQNVTVATGGSLSVNVDYNKYVTGTGRYVAQLIHTESAGGGWGHNNLQPYITCYMWKRIA